MTLRAIVFFIYITTIIYGTYRGIGEYLVFPLFAMIYICYRSTFEKIYIEKFTLLFIAYYLLASAVGFAGGLVSAADMVSFCNRYILIPLTVFALLPRQYSSLRKFMQTFKALMFIPICYGLWESIFHFNPLYKVVTIDASSWIRSMNSSLIYQPSSFFLHYNYYSFILVFLILCSFFFPFKALVWNIIFNALIIEQLIVCQSRMAWIAALLIVFFLFISYKATYSRKIFILACIFFLGIFLLLVFPQVTSKFLNLFFQRFSSVVAFGFEDGSFGQRIGTLLNFGKYFAANPLLGISGTGYNSINNFFLEKYSYYSGYSTADNQYTILLVEVGIIGFVLFCLFIYRLLYRIFYTDKRLCAFILFIIFEGITLDLMSNLTLCVFIASCFILAGSFSYKKESL